MGFVLGLAATFLSILFWSRAAHVDGRHAVARAPWIWGLAGGSWTLTCALFFGHSLFQLAIDQLLVLVLMAGVIALHEHRLSISRQP